MNSMQIFDRQHPEEVVLRSGMHSTYVQIRVSLVSSGEPQVTAARIPYFPALLLSFAIGCSRYSCTSKIACVVVTQDLVKRVASAAFEEPAPIISSAGGGNDSLDVGSAAN